MARRFLIVALGSAGRRHLSVVRRVLPDTEIAVLRRPQSHGDIPDGVVHFDSLDAACAFAPEAAVIASPAPFHVETATRLAETGAHLLIEKPIANHMDGVDALLTTAAARHVVVQVGYCLRFDPSLVAAHAAVASGGIGRVLKIRAEVGHYLPDWRPGADYRDGVSAQASLGGGVLLELSHEIDYVRWFGGEVETIRARTARLGELEMDAENCADLLLDHAGGVRSSVHLDMLQRRPTRHCRIVGTEGTVEWDGIAHAARLFRAGTGDWQTLSVMNDMTLDRMAEAQFRHFLDCIRTGARPLVDGESGRATLAVSLAARRAAAEGCTIRIHNAPETA